MRYRFLVRNSWKFYEKGRNNLIVPTVKPIRLYIKPIGWVFFYQKRVSFRPVQNYVHHGHPPFFTVRS